MNDLQTSVAHLPTPSVGPGSTILTVVGELVEAARANGLDHRVLIEPWRGPDLPTDRIIATAPPRNGAATGPGALVDHALGRIVGRRPVARELYRSSLHGTDLDRIGHVVLHDGSFAYGGVEHLHGIRPDGTYSLYSHVAMSRSLGPRELRRILDRVHRWIHVSDAMADRIRDRIGGDHPALVTVHNGIDPARFAPRPDGLVLDPVVIWAGKVSPEKGPDRVLAALRTVTTTDWTLRVVGSGWYGPAEAASPYERDLRAAGDALPGTVEFTGFLPRADLPGVLQQGRVFVFPTMFDEPFGLALLEAMACGLACVAAPRGGVPEFAADAVLYADPADPEAFGAAVQRLLTDDAAAQDLGRRARERALTLTLDAQFDRFRQVLAGSAEGPSGG
ncbi:MAG: glycosyltransferase family 4 protein [Actinomycetales bacterium]|nr:glycosyltransferase family 4 protein [Candidatus Phosphoribacter baldrii]